MPADASITVEVVYATPERQWLLVCTLSCGATLAQAIEASGIRTLCPGIDISEGKVGIWNRVKPLDTTLVHGDRVEIYRPLLADPKEARRRRARESRS